MLRKRELLGALAHAPSRNLCGTLLDHAVRTAQHTHRPHTTLHIRLTSNVPSIVLKAWRNSSQIPGRTAIK